MGWTERQRQMLQEMGIRLWAPADPQQQAAAEAPVQPPMAAQAPDASPVAAPQARQTTASMAAAVAAPTTASTAGPMSTIDAPDDGGATSRKQMIAGLPWPALRDAVVSCTACTLCETRRQTVFGVGHESAHWMIVGEAPGEQEDQQGEPFVGAAGQLLDNMLHALRLTRGEAPAQRQVYIANTLKCRPPRNRNPEPAELRECEPFLMRQIALVRPRIILAMGRFAVQALLRSSEPVGKLRGRVHEYQGVPLVVTYHPAYLLRNLADKARAWDDLCLAAQTVEAVGDSPPAAAAPL